MNVVFQRLALVYGVLLGGTACHSSRTIPQMLAVPPVARKAPRPRVVTLTGTIYWQSDSAMALSGMNLLFRLQQADSTAQVWRDTTTPTGEYTVTVPAGQTYRLTWDKYEQRGEIPVIYLDDSPSDTLRRNFYVPYVSDCCIDHFSLPAFYFDTNSAALRPVFLTRAQSILRRYAAAAEQKQAALLVVGHAEPAEAPRNHPQKARYLQALALQRAMNTCRYLHAHGMARQRLYVLSRGDRQPVPPNTSPADRQLNRRVEFRLHYLSTAPALDSAASYDALVRRGPGGPKYPGTAWSWRTHHGKRQTKTLQR